MILFSSLPEEKISETWEVEADRYAEVMTQEEYEALMQWAI